MRETVACLLSLSLLPAAAAAQNDCLKEMKMPSVGAWAEYTGFLNHNDPYTVRYAVVGSEAREGTEMKWLEMRMLGAKPDKNMVYQMLTPGTPAEIGEVQEMVFQPGEKPPMKMNPMMMRMIRGQMERNSHLSNLCAGMTVVGEETIEVPAGSFKTVHLHNAEHNSDTWVTQRVPFYLVKTAGKDFELALARTGDGAESSLTGEPQEMPGLGRPKKSK